MKRRTFFATPAVLVAAEIPSEAMAKSNIGRWTFAAAVVELITNVVDLISKYISQSDSEKEGDCTTTTTYIFNGSNCLRCETCLPYMESALIEEAASVCPTGCIEVIVEVKCKN